jgi:two-component system, OmpR family, response regulator QseB
MRLLLIEDDALLGEAVKAGLQQAGYAVDWVRDGHSGRTALRSHHYAVLLLDLGLPDGDGMTLLSELRSAEITLPVLVLSARDLIRDRVRGLDLGADDYLVKPFDLDELTARIRAATRRHAGRSQPGIAIGSIHIDPVGRRVSREDEPVALSHREFRLLLTLAEGRGRVQSRERLEESLYGWGEEIESNAVEVHVHHLRRKLGPGLIETVRGIGYVIR